MTETATQGFEVRVTLGAYKLLKDGIAIGYVKLFKHPTVWLPRTYTGAQPDVAGYATAEKAMAYFGEGAVEALRKALAR